VADSRKLSEGGSKKAPSTWDLDRLWSLLRASVEEIERKQPPFFGTLGIEVNFREGEIETVAVNRRQTLKG
jgi:hypothetical protein